ncbi:MAG TPA: PAS domain S-box protein [Coriobacteriia bacterium]
MRIDQFVMSQEAIDRLGDALLLVGLDGSILDANSAALRCYGHSHTEMLALNIRDIQASQGPGDAGILACEATGHGVPFETLHRRRDGTLFFVRVWSAPVIVDGEQALLNVVHDITERKQAEEILRESEERYQSILNASPDGITLVDLEGRMLMVSAAALTMCGCEREEELLGRPVTDLIVPEDRGRAAANIALLLQGTIPGPNAYRALRPDGSTFDLEVSDGFIRDADGQLTNLVFVVRDITARKRSENALASSESRLKAMFDHAPSGIALIDALTGRICEANPAYARIAGRTIEEICGLDWMSITHPDDLQADLDSTALMNAGETNGYQMKKRYLRPDGTTVWVDMTIAPVLVGDEAHPQHVCMTRDITADKAAEELVARQRERIERTLSSVIDIAGNIVEVRDPYTAGHQRRVAELAVRMAQDLGMSDTEVADIRVAGLLHDVGKAGVPAEILGKPGSISAVELELIKAHAEAGYRIAVSANLEEPIPELIYQHHERCDGSGYPRGLLGAQILRGAKVLAVADVVEAMMSHRPYRPALGVEAALDEIEQGAGHLYDAAVSRACVTLLREGDFAFSPWSESERQGI